MKSIRAIYWLSVGVMLVAGCGPTDEPPAPARRTVQPTVRAEVVEVQSAQVPIRVEVTGQVTARYQATLASRISSMIQQVLVREGSSVKKGQTLVVLDRRDLEAELARATADLENATSHRKRMATLYQQDAVTRQELEDATRAYKVAQAGRNVIVAQLSYTAVKAPFSGVIIDKLVEVGELASPGQPLLRIEDPSELRLEATVAESDLRLISLGARIPVVIDALGSTPLIGTVAQMVPAGDPRTHTFLIKVDLPTHAGLNSGMFGRLQVEKGVSETLLVPSSAVLERGELSSVFVMDADGRARLRWVKIGREFESGVEVLSGLNRGERVLLDASKGRDGVLIEEATALACSVANIPLDMRDRQGGTICAVNDAAV